MERAERRSWGWATTAGTVQSISWSAAGGRPGAWSSLGLTSIPNTIFEKRTEHSQKPSQFWITANSLKEKLEGDAIELFSRSDRPGWDAWGLEAQ